MLTDEMIDRMLAIDALIGRNIMHERPLIEWICSADGGETMTIAFGGQREAREWCDAHPPYEPIRRECWGPYTANPSASKRLRDKMLETGWQYSLLSPVMGLEYMCQFVKSNERYRPKYLQCAGGNLTDISTDMRFFCGKALDKVEEMAVGLAALMARKSEGCVET